jgi:hypothetical protein
MDKKIVQKSKALLINLLAIIDILDIGFIFFWNFIGLNMIFFFHHLPPFICNHICLNGLTIIFFNRNVFIIFLFDLHFLQVFKKTYITFNKCINYCFSHSFFIWLLHEFS